MKQNLDSISAQFTETKDGLEFLAHIRFREYRGQSTTYAKLSDKPESRLALSTSDSLIGVRGSGGHSVKDRIKISRVISLEKRQELTIVNRACLRRKADMQ